MDVTKESSFMRTMRLMEQKLSASNNPPSQERRSRERPPILPIRDYPSRTTSFHDSPPTSKTSRQPSLTSQSPKRGITLFQVEQSSNRRQSKESQPKCPPTIDKHDFAWKIKDVILVKLKLCRRLMGEPEAYFKENEAFCKSAPKTRADGVETVTIRSSKEAMIESRKAVIDRLLVEALQWSVQIQVAVPTPIEIIERHQAAELESIDSGQEHSSPNLSVISNHLTHAVIRQKAVKPVNSETRTRSKPRQKKVSFKVDMLQSPSSSIQGDKSRNHGQGFQYKGDQFENSDEFEPNDEGNLQELVSDQRQNHSHSIEAAQITKEDADGTSPKASKQVVHGNEKKLDHEKPICNKKKQSLSSEFCDKSSVNDLKANFLRTSRKDWFWFDKAYLKLIENMISEVNQKSDTGLAEGPNSPQRLKTGTQEWSIVSPTKAPSESPALKQNLSNIDAEDCSHVNLPSSRIELFRITTTRGLKKRPKRLPPPPLEDVPQTPLPPPTILDEIAECRSQITKILGQQGEQASVFCWSKDGDGEEAKGLDTRTERWRTPVRTKDNPEGARSSASSVRHVGNYLITKGIPNKVSTTRKNSLAKSTLNYSFGEDEAYPNDSEPNLAQSSKKEAIAPDNRDRLRSLQAEMLAKYSTSTPIYDTKRQVESLIQIGSPNLDSYRYSAQDRLENPLFNTSAVTQNYTPDPTFPSDLHQMAKPQPEDVRDERSNEMISDRAGYKNKIEKADRTRIVNALFKQSGNQVEEMLMEDASPRSMTSSGVSPVYTLNRVQQLHRSSRGVPQINLKALIEQNEEVESREVTPRIPAQEEQEEPSREALNRIQVIPNTFNLFVQGKQSPDSLAPREKPLSSKFDHQRLTSLITSQLLTSSLLDEDGIGDRVGLITNQLVNIFDKMHRLGEREDFERVIENVDSKHSELNRSVESFEVVDKGSNPDSTIDWKSVRSHLSSVTNRKKEM